MERTGARPGVGEYLLACIASVAVFPAPAVGYVTVMDPEGWGPIPAVWTILCIYAAFVSIPFAAVGVPLVHVFSRRCATQAGQVAVTGLVTVALFTAACSVDEDLGVFVGLGVGAYTAVATMAGRAAVIPLVRRSVRPELRTRESVHP